MPTLQFRRTFLPILLTGAALMTLTGCAAMLGWASNPDKAEFIYTDLDHFVAAYEKLAGATSTPDSLALMQAYLDEGTKGLKAYGKTYNVTPEKMLAAIRKRPNHYARIQHLPASMRAQEETTRVAYRTLEEHFPKGIYPPIYFLVGPHRAGGTVDLPGLLIAAEIYGHGPHTDPLEFDGVIPHRRTPDRMPHLVAHELVHANMAYQSLFGYIRKWDNLARTMKEGSANYVAEIISGDHINGEAYAYGVDHEQLLWGEFSQTLQSKDWQEWFWRAPSDTTRPRDLGYFFGHRISQALERQLGSQQAAMEMIMKSSNYEKILKRSGYNPQ